MWAHTRALHKGMGRRSYRTPREAAAPLPFCSRPCSGSILTLRLSARRATTPQIHCPEAKSCSAFQRGTTSGGDDTLHHPVLLHHLGCPRTG